MGGWIAFITAFRHTWYMVYVHTKILYIYWVYLLKFRNINFNETGGTDFKHFWIEESIHFSFVKYNLFSV